VPEEAVRGRTGTTTVPVGDTVPRARRSSEGSLTSVDKYHGLTRQPSVSRDRCPEPSLTVRPKPPVTSTRSSKSPLRHVAHLLGRSSALRDLRPGECTSIVILERSPARFEDREDRFYGTPQAVGASARGYCPIW